MLRKLSFAWVLGALFLLGGEAPAQATLVTFDFNSLASFSNSTSIGTYMTSTLNCVSCSVSVAGAVADKTYTGDGHAVGPGNGSTSLTLGNTNGATSSTPTSTLNGTNDTFIANTNDSSGQVASQFTMTFTDIVITGVSFDYEIFPDGTANQPPDFIFTVANGSGPTTVWTKTGVTPGTSPITATHSPNSFALGPTHTEASAQLIGTWSGGFAGGVTELEFTDWPATIAIDNLQITYNYCGPLGLGCTGIQGGPPTLVPTPASLPLLGTGLFLLAWTMRRKLSQRA
jgi:hypothetical protein